MPHKPTYKELEKRVRELEQAELESKQIEEELAQIFSMSLDMVCIADIETATFIKVNPAFSKTLGHSEKAFLDKPFLAFVHPDDIDATQNVIKEKLKSGAKVINFENRYRCKDGSYRWLSWVSHPNPEKGVTYAVARDITQWKQNQEEMKRSKTLLDATGRMARVGGWELDADTLEVTWTEETYHIHEVPPGHRPALQSAINFFHPDDRAQLKQAIERALENGEPYDMEIRFITAKGNHIWTRTKCEPEVVDGKVVTLKGTFQDITERKQAVEEVKSAKAFMDTVLDLSPFAMWIADQEGNVTRTNHSLRKTLNLADEMIVGKYNVLKDANLENQGVMPLVKAVFDEHEAVRFSIPWKADEAGEVDFQGGKDIYIDVSIFPILNGAGELTNVVCQWVDITELKQAEEALRESEAKYKRISDNSPAVLYQFLMTQSGEVSFPYVSDIVESIFGVSPEEIIKDPSKLLDMVHPEDQEIFNERIMKSAETLESFPLEFRCIKDGEVIWVEARGVPTPLTNGGILWDGFLLEVTDRKQAEEALQESELQFKSTFEQAAVGIAHVALDGTWLRVNQKLCDIVGYSREELISKTFQDITFSEDLDADLEYVRQMLAEEIRTYSMEKRYIRKDGSLVWINLTVSLVHNATGDPDYFISIIEDINIQKQAEEALKENNRFIDKIINTAPNLVYIYDLVEKCNVYSNDGMEKLLGFGVNEIREMGETLFPTLLHPDDLGKVIAHHALLKKSTDGEIFKVDYRMKNKQDAYRILRSWDTTFKRGGDGTVLQIIGLAVDVTDQIKAEESLKFEKERAKQYLDVAGVILIALGKDRRVTLINPKGCEILGYPQEDIIGKDWFDNFLFSENIEEVKGVFHQIMSGGIEPVEYYENPVKTRTGDNRLIAWHNSVLKDSDGNVTGLFSSGEDITEQKRAEEELRESENKLRATLDAAAFPVAIVDSNDDKVYFWSESAHSLFGHTATSAAEWYQLAYPDPDYRADVIKRWKPFLEIARESQQPVNTGEYEVTCKDGSVRICEIYATFLPDNLIVTFNDITERKQAEKALQESKKRNQALLDHSPVCHKIVDLDYNLQYMSANGFKMLKLDADADVYGKPYPFEFFPAAFRNDMTEKMKMVRETGETLTLEALAGDIDGNEVWLDSSLIPVFNEIGKIDFITVVSADITEKKLAEKEKAHLEGQLNQAQKMEAVGRLAGGVAHDFNNMLSLIIGHSEMALEEVEPSLPLYAHLKEIKNAGKRSADLTRQLLAFARKETISPKVLDLNETVESMIRMLRRLMGEDIDLAWRPGNAVWPVKMDPSQLDQILANLCVNARDAIADVGRVTIETGNADFDENYCNDHPGFVPGAYVLLAVSDNGCGMDSETVENIFEPFFTTKVSGKGTGLGLATVYGAVKQNNGFINVYSEPEHGTVFKIYLPRHRTGSDVLLEQGKGQAGRPGP